MPVIGLFMALAGNLGLAGRMQKVAGWAMAVAAVPLLLGALWGGWKLFDHFNDRQAVQRDIAKSNAELATRQVQAERTAGAAFDNAIDVQRNDQQTLEEKVHAARRNRRSALDALAD
jgi:hypothetical protein